MRNIFEGEALKGVSNFFLGKAVHEVHGKKNNAAFAFILVVLTVFLVFDVVQATYKKPPFNGSIFGKRSNGITDYDSAGRTLSSLCEVAVEACSLWFPQMEAKK